MLAVGALCGIPIARIIDGDEVEQRLWLAVVERASELRVQMMHAEASHIGNEIAKRL